MTRHSLRGIALTVALLLLLAGACSKDSAPAARAPASSATTPSSTPVSQIVPGKTRFGANDDDVIIAKAVDDVQSFYEQAFPELYGGQFDPLKGGLFPYGPDNPPPNCGAPGKSDYQEVAQNAFYCPQ